MNEMIAGIQEAAMIAYWVNVATVVVSCALIAAGGTLYYRRKGKKNA